MPDALYEQLDEHRWRATARTTGPWSPDAQHAGPPSALLGTVLADALGAGRMVRWTFEILRPVPVAELTTSVEVLRPGHKVAMGRAVLADDAGPVMTVQGWRIRERDVPLPPDRPDRSSTHGTTGRPDATDGTADARPGGTVDVTAMPGPHEAVAREFFPVDWDEGYHTAVEIRFVHGAFRASGDAAAWLRCRVPLVAGTELTPLQRLLVAADTGNGISSRLDTQQWLFVNTDLTVHVRDHPVGEWVGLDARTRFGPDGIGLATAQVHGAQGPIGTAHQSLIVEPR